MLKNINWVRDILYDYKKWLHVVVSFRMLRTNKSFALIVGNKTSFCVFYISNRKKVYTQYEDSVKQDLRAFLVLKNSRLVHTLKL